MLKYYAVAAAAKSLQSCLTRCDPIDGSPPGSSVPGILQARTLEGVAISFSVSWSLLKPMFIELVMASNHLSSPLSPLTLPAIDLSQHQGPLAKVLEFQLQHLSFQ